MQSNYYSMLFRMKYIDRWALMRNVRNENLSEHSLDVAFIAHALALIKNRRFGGSVNPEKAAVAAMFHDTSEVITGDLPTPVKYYNPEIKTAYKKIERAAEQKLLELLPLDLKEDFKEIYEPDEDTQMLVKAADKLAALIKCAEELRFGNSEFLAAKTATMAAIDQLNLPEASVFIEEFLPAFSLSLDEQGI